MVDFSKLPRTPTCLGPDVEPKQLEFDCAAKADREGQPKPFVLIASDPLAPNMVNLWGHLSNGDLAAAIACFGGLVNDAAQYSREPRNHDKVYSAFRIAHNMKLWRDRR